MPRPTNNKKELDPMVLMAQKFRAKCHFRACGRLVMANAYWLIEDVDHYEGDDVKRRVQQAVQRSKGKKQLLSIKDKALLNKPAEHRTEPEKKYIYNLIGNLKCFKRYPNHVKKKLAAVTYFKYYGPGRVIVRENQEAYAMYFLVSGSMVATRMELDVVTDKMVALELGVINAGDVFGEVSLLHNIPRTATVTTTAHCEVLQLLKEDFKNILLVSIQQQWDEIRDAMGKFTYFESFDEQSLRDGCTVAKMKDYEPNEIILGNGQGSVNYVYFVLTGRCQMVESIKVITKSVLGKTFYTLYDPFVPKEESDEDFEKKWITNYPGKRSETGYVSSNIQVKSSMLSTSFIEGEEGKQRESDELNKKGSDETKQERSDEFKKGSILKRKSSNARSSILKGSSQPGLDARSSRQRGGSGGSSGKRTSFLNQSPGASKQNATDQKLSPIAEEHSYKTLLDSTASPDPRQSIRVNIREGPKIRTYYMQICQFLPGASFGLGENLRDRRILALTPTRCLLLPKVWLLQRNTANIWTRIQYFLNKKIPKKKQLFEEFIQQRKWEDYKFMLVDDILRNAKTVNYTSIHDVPYSIRMEEMVTDS